jgi:hypothetical protein
VYSVHPILCDRPIFFLFFLLYWDLNLGPTLLQPFFVIGFFIDRVLQTICLGWLQTKILLSSLDYRHEPLVPSSVFLLIYSGIGSQW